MKALSSGSEIAKSIVEGFKSCKHFDCAVAWGSHGSDCFDEMLRNISKARKFVVGIHFYQTHPEFLNAVKDQNTFRVVTYPDGVFHPKVYYFENSDGSWKCIIGSANFTVGAFSRNQEIGIEIVSKDVGSKDVQEKILKEIQGYWAQSETITPQFLKRYTNIWRAKEPKRNDLQAVFGKEKDRPIKRERINPLQSRIYSLKWADYIEALYESESKQSISERLEILSEAKDLFEKHGGFDKFSDTERKAIAGFIETENINWKYFGSMAGAGKFKKEINTNNRFINDALNEIPLVGGIDKNHYDKFQSKFKTAFPGANNMLATSSRLLAMKRPDYFICLDSKNLVEFCKDFGIKKSIVTTETYWDEVIELVHSCIWWESQEPTNQSEKALWMGRAALLDVLYYEYE